MLLFVDKAHPTITTLYTDHPNVGRLVTPRSYGRINETNNTGIPWAADNDAFNDFDPDAYMRMLSHIRAIQPHHGIFITVPDVVGDHDATLDLFNEWVSTVALTGPVALVAQDGLTPNVVPWIEIDALFIGGTTEWKLSPAAHTLITEAKHQGKWVHMGRVNTWRRAQLAMAWGCDSIDGTKFSRFTDTYLPKFTRKLRDSTPHTRTIT